jgi:hypothetical protein
MRAAGAVRARSRRESLRRRWHGCCPRRHSRGCWSACTTALAIREFNEYVLTDDRVDLVMLAVGDGLTLARAR